MSHVPTDRPLNPTNALGGVTLMPGSGGGGGSMQASSGNIDPWTMRNMANPLSMFGPGGSAFGGGSAEMPPPPMAMPGGYGGGRGHGGGGWGFAPDDGQRIGGPGPAMQAPTTADWTADNAAAGGHGLTPNYGSNLDQFYGMQKAKASDAPPGSSSGGVAKRANGGPLPMRVGQPTVVGEHGIELIMPRDDGSGFVLPTDVTRQVLPMMRDVTPRAQGGGTVEQVSSVGLPGMEMAVRGFQSPYGSGVGTTITGMAPSPLMASSAPGRYLADERGQIDPATMAPMPDVLPPGHPLQMAALPAPDAGPLRQFIARTNESLAQRGATPVDQPLQDMRWKGIETQAALDNARFDAEQLRVQNQVAARASRGPLGSAVIGGNQPVPMAPGMSPATQRIADKNLERFYRSPQGAMMLAQQGQQNTLMQQRGELARTALPVTDPATGATMGWVNGLGASLPTPATAATKRIHSQREINGQLYNFYTDGTQEAVQSDGAGQAPLMAWDGSKVISLPPNTNLENLPAGLTLLNPPEPDGTPATAPTAASATTAAAPAAPAASAKSQPAANDRFGSFLSRFGGNK